MGDRRITDLVVLAAVVITGLVGAMVALGNRDPDSEFLFRQDNPRRLLASEVERVVRAAPDPRVGGTVPGIAADCKPGRPRGLRNPWTCVISYETGRTARLRVRFRADGSYLGRYAGGGAAEGCCINLPG